MNNIKRFTTVAIVVMLITGFGINGESITASVDYPSSSTTQGSVETSTAVTSTEESVTSNESFADLSTVPTESYTVDDGYPAEDMEKPGRIVLVGDSRTMHIGNYLFGLPMEDGYVDGCTPDGDCILGIGGEGYSWLAGHTPEIEARLTDGCALVINMGVNGAPRFHREIAGWCNQMAEKHKDRGIKVYFMSVNPVNDSKLESFNYLIRNSDVIYFNNSIKPELDGVIYIDAYSVAEYDIVDTGEGTHDGLHYRTYVCRKIWDHVVEVVRGK